MRSKLIHRLRNNPRGWLTDAFPICKWLPKYQISDIPYDMLAGVTLGLTILPLALAYAQMCYMRAEYGLYSAFLAAFVYIFIGTSKDAIIAPTAISSMLLAQFNVHDPLYMSGDNTYGAILAMTNGIVLVLMGVFKLGFIVNLFSIPVVSGFTSASAFAITASQLKTIFGIKKGPNDSPGVFIKQIMNIYQRRSEIQIIDVTFGFASLAFLLGVEYAHVIFLQFILPRFPKPKSDRGLRIQENFLKALQLLVRSRNVILFITATGISYAIYSSNPEEMQNKMTVVGYVKPGFPIPSFPKFQVTNRTMVAVNTSSGIVYEEQEVVLQSMGDIFSGLSIGLFIMPLMAVMEMMAILKALGRKNGYRIDPTQELIAVGLGNFFQSFIGAIPVTAATAKTALNDQCQVRSQLSAFVRIAIVLISIGTLTHIFFYVPKPALSAILIAAAHHLFDYHTVSSNSLKLYHSIVFVVNNFIVRLFRCGKNTNPIWACFSLHFYYVYFSIWPMELLLPFY